MKTTDQTVMKNSNKNSNAKILPDLKNQT